MNTSDRPIRVGLDVGALFVKAVVLDEQGRCLFHRSLVHKGEIFRATRTLLSEAGVEKHSLSLGIVGTSGALVAHALGLEEDNEVAAIVRGVTANYSDVRQVIDVGGGSLSLVELDEQGAFSGYQTNTICAAGTGSFLDEQAARLGVDYARLASMEPVEHPPSIAARCAVFAKSDLIHRQQEGFGKVEMWSGLCKGLARTILMTLFKGRKPQGKTVMVGGVARNREVVRWLSEALPGGLEVAEYAQEIGAWGAALAGRLVPGELDLSRLDNAEELAEGEFRRKPLSLIRSEYPSFEVESFSIDDEGNEIRISQWPENGSLRGYLGIDIGSTSTKLMLVNEDEQVVLDIYRKTGGDPIGATQSLFRALKVLAKDRGGEIEILGVGTTGSGRKLLGAVIGADRVINEISAHVAGAMHVDPEIDTIFEIGGQDAKYVHTVHGQLHNANMNYVCAAGTGSFVEELSRKMGFDLFTLGDEVLGVTPPTTSDRCTVFMDQDARTLLRKGYSRREVMGAVMYSVVQNYLNKVVGNRYYSKKKVFFQGATARNKGLVAAFENLLDVEVVVSSYCHVMGCWGVALLTKRKMAEHGEESRFVGLDFAEKKVKLSSEDCTLCQNHCHITYAEVDGLNERPSWGYLCGRDPEDTRVKSNKDFKYFRQRLRLWKTAGDETKLPNDAPVIGYPRALLAYSYTPLWRRFFAELGYRLELSPQTDEDIVKLSSDWVGGDYCHPVKLAHGHLRYLLEKRGVERVFAPYMVNAGDNPKTTQSYFCPYNIALPAMLRSAAELNGLDSERVIAATLDLRWDEKTAVERLTDDLGEVLGRRKKDIARAWKRAQESHLTYENQVREAGKAAMDEFRASGKPGVVVLGRPYNTIDAGANLALPEKISRLGFQVIPLDYLPLDEEEIGSEFGNLFWNFGRKIIEAVRYIARTPNLYAVYFSNFSCGPDSFIQTYAEEVMGEKPMLMLELDEHGADAGYLTRLEAFADVLHANEVEQVAPYSFSKPSTDAKGLEGRTLWLPPMGEPHPRFMAAVMRHAGIEARALPVEDRDAFLKGREHTRGGECVPCPATLGTFLATVEREGGDPNRHALFMPTASGPCRFGQYCTLDRMIFKRIGWDTLPIVSWTSTDSYDGTDEKTRRKMWSALVLGDLLFKMRCKVLPYEKNPGQTEALYERWIGILDEMFSAGRDLAPVVDDAKRAFLDVPVRAIKKPLVGIVGEIYVRNNRFTNQDVVRRIEKVGGEAWLAPISEWIIYTAYMESWTKGYRSGSLGERMGAFLKNRFLAKDEAQWTKSVSPLLDDRHEPSISSTVHEGARFVPMDFRGGNHHHAGKSYRVHEGWGESGGQLRSVRLYARIDHQRCVSADPA